MNNPEEVLLKRSQAGDEVAFRTLVEQHSKALLGVAYLMTRDRGLAEDALQNTLLQMWKHLDKLRANGLKTWLVRVMMNEVKQLHRKNRKPVPAPGMLPGDEHDPVDLTETVIRHENHRCLKQALEALPPDYREVVILRYFAELTITEIAAATGQLEGTVKSRLSRALDRLEKILKDNRITEMEVYHGQNKIRARAQ